MKLKHLLVTVVVAIVTLPVAAIAAIAVVKPLRAAVPALMPGIECPDANICIDDLTRLGEARNLYQDGYAITTGAVGAFQQSPRLVFCATQACADRFGMGRRAALAVGNLGMVVAPRGWKPYFVAHELIHFRQAETLGNFTVATGPGWLIEGMAYSLSGDPRHPLTEPFEQWRSQFEAWHAAIGSNDLWEAAGRVRK